MKTTVHLIFLMLAVTLSVGIPFYSDQALAAGPDAVAIDWATYNPVSLVLKDKGWLEEMLPGVKVTWRQSTGSNRALTMLEKNTVDFGSTAGASAILAKTQGAPINSIYTFSKPEWTALVTMPNSGIKSISDLKGKKVAVTKGTDPNIFLFRALAANNMAPEDLQLVFVQHNKGAQALLAGKVDAWGGLDPMMADLELNQNAKLFYRDVDLNSYGILNVRSEFAQKYPEVVDKVLMAYEKGRKWALENPAEMAEILAKEAELSVPVAKKQLERTDLSNPILGKNQYEGIKGAALTLQKVGLIDSGADITKFMDALFDYTFGAKLK